MTSEEEEIMQEIKERLEPVKVEEVSPADELENDFDEFKKSKSEHNIEPESPTEETKEEKKEDFIPESDNLSIVEDFKLQIFLGLFFSLLDGIHIFLYRFVSKVEINKDDFTLADDDKANLEIYFKTNRVLQIINKLPSELIGLVHMEYMYYQKFQDIKKAAENPKKTLPQKEPGEKRAPAKRKPRKRKPTKKKPASE